MNNFLFFTIIVSLFWAIYEIQIEGNDGWAEKLPTWRIKNPLRKIFNWPYLDGYHIWLFVLSFTIFHLPYFLGFQINIQNELVIITNFVIFGILEDFFWFVFNPNWGIKKFFSEEIPWHKGKILGFPKNYWICSILLIILSVFKLVLLSQVKSFL